MYRLNLSGNPIPLAIFVTCTCVPLTAAGQKNGSPAPQTAVLEEIIVTATRREQRLQHVPLSVHVVTEEELRRLGAVAFAEYARTVPGLSFTDGGTGGEKQTIRGISVNPWFEVNPGTAVHLGRSTYHWRGRYNRSALQSGSRIDRHQSDRSVAGTGRARYLVRVPWAVRSASSQTHPIRNNSRP